VSELTIGIIGGTGIGETFADRSDCERIDVDTPFGSPSGPILRSVIGGVTCFFLSRHGEGHLLNPSRVPYRANLFALKKLGVTDVVASGATGSLREEIQPGDLVICDQVIDKTFRRAGTFFEEGMVAHVELADPFCERLRGELLAAGESVDTTIHDRGTYVCMEGPQFSTRAESHMHRAWGGDLSGMTCMPEAKLAREAELCYALIALPTDYDCWRPRAAGTAKQALIAEIMSNMRRASEAAMGLIHAVIARLGASARQDCVCRDALELAIWSDKALADRETVNRLRPLVARYFADKP